MQPWRIINSRNNRLSNTVSLLALMVESFVVKAGSKLGTDCQRHLLELAFSIDEAKDQRVLRRAKVVDGSEVEQGRRALAHIGNRVPHRNRSCRRVHTSREEL